MKTCRPILMDDGHRAKGASMSVPREGRRIQRHRTAISSVGPGGARHIARLADVSEDCRREYGLAECLKTGSGGGDDRRTRRGHAP